MGWTVLLDDAFESELTALSNELQDELFAHARLLAEFGPDFGRPTIDTLNGSQYPNMKEMRFCWRRQSWRIAFAFDPLRQAILLVGGNKRGKNQDRFYRQLIKVADERYATHLACLAKETEDKANAKKT